MMVIEVVGPTYIYGNKKYFLCDTMIADYRLKKKAQSIAYYLVRKGEKIDE